MTQHAIGTREEWLAASRELLDAEKAHMRQGDELAFDVGVELALGAQQLSDHPLVAVQRQRCVARQLGRQVQRRLLELRLGHDAVDQPPPQGGPRVDVAAEQEQLARARDADRVDEPAQAGVRYGSSVARKRLAAGSDTGLTGD